MPNAVIDLKTYLQALAEEFKPTDGDIPEWVDPPELSIAA